MRGRVANAMWAGEVARACPLWVGGVGPVGEVVDRARYYAFLVGGVAWPTVVVLCDRTL